MPEISSQHQCAALADLIAVESFGTPIGDLPAQTDSWIFPRGWKGTAEVVATVRKVYMIIS